MRWTASVPNESWLLDDTWAAPHVAAAAVKPFDLRDDTLAILAFVLL